MKIYKIVAMMLMMSIIISSGCIDVEQPKENIKIDTPTSTIPVQIQQTSTPLPVKTKEITDDEKFIRSVLEPEQDNIMLDIKKLQESLIKGYPYSNIESWGKYLKEDITRQYIKIKDLNVSTVLQQPYKEYIISLELYYSVSIIAESGEVKNYNDYGRETLSDKLDEGNTHMLRSLSLIKEIIEYEQ